MDIEVPIETGVAKRSRYKGTIQSQTKQGEDCRRSNFLIATDVEAG